MKYYTCLRELVPVIESALAAEGYVLAPDLYRQSGHTRITVMTCGDSVISLHEDSTCDMAYINVHCAHHTCDDLAILKELPRLEARHSGQRYSSLG